jgi:selenium metabolism protein YedF
MRGKPCPEPVIETRKALANGEVSFLTVLVDNEGSAENVARCARQLACDVSLEQEAGFFRLMLRRDPSMTPVSDNLEPAPSTCGLGSDVVVLISSKNLGDGSEELGRLLMVAFLKTIGKVVPRPKTLVFMNAGVQLATQGSEVLEALRELEGQGTKIWSCGTCLDYFQLKDQLAVGSISNMFDIASVLFAADRVIRP